MRYMARRYERPRATESVQRLNRLGRADEMRVGPGDDPAAALEADRERHQTRDHQRVEAAPDADDAPAERERRQRDRHVDAERGEHHRPLEEARVLGTDEDPVE